MRFDPRLWRGGPLTEHIGDLDVPSGDVSICDAGTLFGPVPVAVPPGRYPVRVLKDLRGDNVAVALRVGGTEPVRWSEDGTFGVDAGMAGLFDSKLLAKLERQDFPTSIYDDLIQRHLDPAEDEGRAGAMVPFDGGAFAACRSGHGDGFYSVWVGRDTAGKVAVVVTEFIEAALDVDELDVEDAPTEQG